MLITEVAKDIEVCCVDQNLLVSWAWWDWPLPGWL